VLAAQGLHCGAHPDQNRQAAHIREHLFFYF
jgi:hypothetical protein